jgi:hypothetical protein
MHEGFAFSLLPPMSNFVGLLLGVHWFDLLNAPQMTTSLERGLQPDAHHVKRDRLVNRALSESKHIGIVVQT